MGTLSHGCDFSCWLTVKEFSNILQHINAPVHSHARADTDCCGAGRKAWGTQFVEHERSNSRSSQFRG